MKSITSKEPISFVYDSQNKLEFTSEPTIVNDEIARVAEERLGDQIETTDVGNDASHEGEGGEGDNSGPSHADLKARAKELGLKQNGTKEELVERIGVEETRLEVAAAAEARAAELAAQGKKEATQDDIDADPALVEAGVKVGDIIDVPPATV